MNDSFASIYLQIDSVNLKRSSTRNSGRKSSPKVNPGDDGLRRDKSLHAIPAIAVKEAAALEKNKEKFELMNRVSASLQNPFITIR